MTILSIIVIAVIWYIIGYFSFIFSIGWKYGSVDTEDTGIGFIFAVGGPLIILILVIGELIIRIPSYDLTYFLNNLIDKVFKRWVT